MAERIAHGTIEIEVNDRDAIARLHALQAEYEAAMHEIGRRKTTAEIDATIAPLEDKVANARRTLKELEGQKATATLDADKSRIQRAINAGKKDLAKWEGQKATAELDLKFDEKQWKAAQARAEALKKELEDYKKELIRTRAVEEKAERDRLAGINKSARVSSALRKQQDREEAASTRQAVSNEKARMDAINRRARVSASLDRQRQQAETQALRDHSEALRMERDRTVGVAREKSQVISLQREYAKLTDRMEALQKRRAFSLEGRAKLALDTGHVAAEMERVKAELNFLGKHPPVEIQVEVDRRRSMPFLRRQLAGLSEIGKGALEKIANIGDITTRLGPFTGSIKQFGVALGFLGPVILDLVGSAGSLISVLGAGLAGAATVGAGAVVGLATGIGGLALSLKTAKADYKIAKTATDAYTKAVDKYGKGSKQAKDAQDQMNSVLKHVSPLARQAAEGMTKFQGTWDKLTRPTQSSFGNIAKGFFGSLNAIAPEWAHLTNNLSDTLDHSLRGGFKFLRSGEFKHDFSTIGDNFNKAVPGLMRGLGNFGRAFLNFAREGSKALTPMANGFKRMGQNLLNFTQRDNFGSTVKKWVGYAKDLVHFFGAAGRVLVHFFSTGEKAGDGLLKSMTGALDRWDRFLTSDRGSKQFADGFQRAADGATSLWHVLSPLVGLFVTWASKATPLVTFITDLLSGFSKVASVITKLLGLLDGIPGLAAAIGVALGAAFVVSKIAAVAGAIINVVNALKEARAVAAGGGILKGITSLPSLLKGGAAGAATVGAGAAVDARAAKEAARWLAEAETVAAAGSAEIAGVATAAGTAEVGVLGLSGALGALATGGLAIAAAGAVYLGIKLLSGKSAADKLASSIKANARSLGNWVSAAHNSQLAATGAGQSMFHYRDSIKQVSKLKAQLTKLEGEGKRGTEQYRSTLDQLNSALMDRASNEKDVNRFRQDEIKYNKIEATASGKRIQMEDDLNKAEDNLRRTRLEMLHGRAGPADVAKAEGLVTAARKNLSQWTKASTTAENEAAVAHLNYKRGLNDLIPLTGKAATALAKLSRINPNVSAKVSLKFADPKDAARVARNASSALSHGVSQRVVMKIIADSRDAEQAIRRLNARTLTPKKLEIIQHGGQAAVNMLEKILGRKLTPKEQKITEQGGNNVLAKLGAIGTKGLPVKTQNIKENGAQSVIGMIGAVIARAAGIHDKTFTVAARDAASGTLGHIAGLLGSLASKTVNVVTNFVTHGRPGGKASGGVGGDVPAVNRATERRQDAAFAAAFAGRTARSTTQGLKGGMKIVGPRAIYGEEPQHPEFVISTNPAYKGSNIRYLRAAAQQLGLQMSAAGTNPLDPTATKAGYTGAAYGATHMKFHSHKTHPRPAKKFRKHRNASVFKQRRSWTGYVSRLQTSQSDWEREVQLREGDVRVPDDWVIEGPTQVVKGPDGKPVLDSDGKPITSLTYMENPDVKAKYIPDMQKVMDAYRQLLRVVAELVRAIPLAQQAIDIEVGQRRKTIHTLDKQITDTGKKLRRKGQTDAQKQSLATSLDKLKTKRGKEKDTVKGLLDDRRTLTGDRKDAGFSYREDYQQYKQAKTDLDAAVGGKYSDDAKKQTTDAYKAGLDSAPSTGTGSGSGTGSDTPTIPAQIITTDAARAQVYRDYGSNFFGSVGVGPAMASMFAGGPLGANASAAGASLSSSAGAAAATPSSGGRSAFTGPAGGAAPSGNAPGGSTVVVNNTFASVPPDPHTWSKGVQFELGAMI